MFDRVDGKLVGSKDQMQLFWTELPEFGFLQNHKFGDVERGSEDANEKLNVLDKARILPEAAAQIVLQEAFIEFLAQLLGFDVAKFEPASPLTSYGIDSLSAVSCQYWLHRSTPIY
jgi:hypothetical protein